MSRFFKHNKNPFLWRENFKVAPFTFNVLFAPRMLDILFSSPSRSRSWWFSCWRRRRGETMTSPFSELLVLRRRRLLSWDVHYETSMHFLPWSLTRRGTWGVGSESGKRWTRTEAFHSTYAQWDKESSSKKRSKKYQKPTMQGNIVMQLSATVKNRKIKLQQEGNSSRSGCLSSLLWTNEKMSCLTTTCSKNQSTLSKHI